VTAPLLTTEATVAVPLNGNGSGGPGASARLQAALEYAARGRRVIVLHGVTETGACTCQPGSKPCKAPGKHPRIADWPQRAATDFATIREWWTRWPDSNVGVITGGGLVVLDVDHKHDGPRKLAALIDNLGEPLPDTPTVATGGGGSHHYFAGDALSTTPIEGIEFKAAGRLVVAPPSVHASGREYAWLIPPTVPLAPLPAWLRDLAGGSGSARPAEHWLTIARDGVAAGSRNLTTASLAGHLLRLSPSLDPQVALELIVAWDAQRNRPPLGRAEVVRVVESIARKELRRRRGEPA
jgi:hypothetical protein